MVTDSDIDMDHLLFTKDSLIPTIGAFALTVILLSVSTIDFLPELYDTQVFTSETRDWTVQFDTSIVDDDDDGHTFSHTEIWADDETKVVDFDFRDLVLPEGKKIGYISVSIYPEEDTGISLNDPDWGCDSIGVSVMSDNSTLPAQWQDDRNILLGNDADCEVIPIFLQAYPFFYDDNSANMTAKNDYQAMIPWNEDGWGLGVFSLQIDIDVQSYGGQGVGIVDDDEEITITVDVVTFSGEVVEVE